MWENFQKLSETSEKDVRNSNRKIKLLTIKTGRERDKKEIKLMFPF